ncbi:hypothetical protein [Paenibacillus spongiae]|uniref:Uncharacterized protein n=1 Tax=Paenibacillus spongiae TaxID=2909671 RepID=A0ABY5SG28_9BACL|nr:hypothetical protein [Paenibacillus spongiae]UVI31660.1 hypothetical protein L1F29_07510 [Paenibacillus spongiae]
MFDHKRYSAKHKVLAYEAIEQKPQLHTTKRMLPKSVLLRSNSKEAYATQNEADASEVSFAAKQ